MTRSLPDFSGIGFSGQLRPSQLAAVSVIEPELAASGKKLHIVAPPGSGKTVLGLYVWSTLVRKPTLVLSPNSAIQAQWAARTSLFDLNGKEAYISTDPQNPGILTSLTYQSITMPRRGGEDFDAAALELWANSLMESGEAESLESAEAWILDLEKKNEDYYNDRLKVYRKKVRDEFTAHGNALWTLHESAKQTLQRLKEVGVGLIILDECHHLLHHWGKVLQEVREFFDDPIVLGLTATPPEYDSIKAEDADRYSAFFGDIDYEVPVPALVRDSNLSAYQDLSFFVRPSEKEMEYITQVDASFYALVGELEGEVTQKETPPLHQWVFNELNERQPPGRKVSMAWTEYHAANERFADAARRYLTLGGHALPSDVPPPHAGLIQDTENPLAYLRPVLDRYVRYGLMRSEVKSDHEKAQDVIERLRLMGTQITEKGARSCASPVSRILAYSSSKVEALSDIITTEMQSLSMDIRAVVVTDFEKTSATTLVDGILDDEAGGAIAAFRQLVSCSAGDLLDPVLMTGSTVLVDDDLCERFLEAARNWVNEKELTIEFEAVPFERYYEIRGSGKDWIPRYYSLMITEFFQQGLTKCLIGTRGLLGEGWDASKINVLVDLTTVTTSMSINQLRGRSIRLDSDWKEKVANNWDVICMAEEFANGFADYDRFMGKHRHLYGVCDDGGIEKGVGHVHAAFTEAQPEGISEGMNLFNEEMLRRSRNRPLTRELWGIGQPFSAKPTDAVEVKVGGGFSAGFPLTNEMVKWSDESLIETISHAVGGALIHLGHLSQQCKPEGGSRGGGWVRMHLRHGTEEESAIFSKAMDEILGPLENPRYVVSRSSRFVTENWLSKLLPEVLAKYARGVRTSVVMHHTIPSLLARKREDAELFLRYWEHYFGPSEMFYARNTDGKQRLETILQNNLVPVTHRHRKQIFL